MRMLRQIREKSGTLRGKLILSTLLMLLFISLLLVGYEVGIGMLMEQRTLETFNGMADEMDRRLEQSIGDIARTAKVVAYSATVQEQLLSQTRLDRLNSLGASLEVMKIALDSTDKVKNIIVCATNGNRLSYSTFGLELLDSQLASIGFDEGHIPAEPRFGGLFEVDTGTSRIPHVMFFIPIFNILPDRISKEPMGVCAVICDVRSLTGAPVADFPNDGFTALLVGGDLLASNRALTETESLVLRLVPDPSASAPDEDSMGRLPVGEVTYLTWSIPIQEIGIRFVAACSEQGLMAPWRPLRAAGLAILFVAAITLPLLLGLAIRGVSKPMESIMHDMDALETAHDGDRIRVPASIDMARLAHGINRMLDRIEEAVRTETQARDLLYKAQIEQHRAQLLSYRSQINPHFLFNTLECMRSMAQVDGNPYLEKLSSSMASMFRYSLKAGPVVELEEEMTHTVNYFNVMSLRYPGRYHLRIHLTEDARHHAIHTMVLQPLVENAIHHGFADRKGFCTVMVNARTNGRRLFLHVIDDGAGIPPDRLKQLNSGLSSVGGMKETETSPGGECSIGLQNIHRRLSDTFGAEYRMNVRSVEGHYTAVRLVIPAEPSEAS